MSNSKNDYVTPVVEFINFSPEGILCFSFEKLEEEEGEWGN